MPQKSLSMVRCHELIKQYHFNTKLIKITVNKSFIIDQILQKIAYIIIFKNRLYDIYAKKNVENTNCLHYR